MSKWVKLLLKISGGLIALVLILILAAYLFAAANKKKILTEITSTFHEKSTGTLSVGDLDFSMFEEFPSFVVRIREVAITDSFSLNPDDTLLVADKISFRLHLLKLATGQIQLNSLSISDASVNIVKDTLGNVNTPKARYPKAHNDEKGGPLPVLSRINLDNVSFTLDDHSKKKRFAIQIKKATLVSENTSPELTYQMEGRFHFGELLFNPVKGGYLTDQELRINTLIHFNPEAGTLVVPNAELEAQKQLLSLHAAFDFKQKKLALEFNSASILPSVAYSLLTPAIRKKLVAYDLVKPIMIHASIVGSLEPGSKPAVDVFFKTTGNQLNIKDRTFDSLSMTGWFVNHIDSTKINDDHNSKVIIPVFNGTYFRLPIRSQMEITDLVNPVLYMDARVSYDQDQHGDVTTQFFHFTEGQMDVRYIFDGPLVHFIDTVNKVMIGRLDGSINISKAAFTYMPADYQITNANGKLSFSRPHLSIDSLHLTLNGNELFVKGEAQYFVSFLFIETQEIFVDLDVKARSVNFNSFKKPKSGSPQQVSKPAKHKKSLGSAMDWLAHKTNLAVKLNAEKMTFKKFNATNVVAELEVNRELMRIKEAGMTTSGGQFTMSSTLSRLNSSRPHLDFQMKIADAKVNDIMYSFENFNQAAVTDQTISGTLTSQVSLKADLTNEFKVIPPTLKGKASLTVKNGRLKNHKGLESVGKYLFKHRDFSNVEFADLKNDITINGRLLEIGTLDVFSSVLTLFAKGTYDLNHENTNITVTVPLSNLKKMEAEERMALTETTASKGGTVTLRAVNGKDGKIKIEPVLFSKEKKNNTSGESGNKKKNRTLNSE
jgi:hypothetical protein